MFFFLVFSVGLVVPSWGWGSFNQKWLLCEGCSGSGSRGSPPPRGRRLLSGAGGTLRRPPHPPAGQAVSPGGGRCLAAWCWRLWCAGGRRSGGTRLCSIALDPEMRGPGKKKQWQLNNGNETLKPTSLFLIWLDLYFTLIVNLYRKLSKFYDITAQLIYILKKDKNSTSYLCMIDT